MIDVLMHTDETVGLRMRRMDIERRRRRVLITIFLLAVGVALLLAAMYWAKVWGKSSDVKAVRVFERVSLRAAGTPARPSA